MICCYNNPTFLRTNKALVWNPRRTTFSLENVRSSDIKLVVNFTGLYYILFYWVTLSKVGRNNER